MNDRYDLPRQLGRVSEWVRDEMAFLADFAAGLGASGTVESGPGLAFGIGGRKVVHVHPKRGHIGIGLPDRLRPDVDELTSALRAQRGLAWFNYEPGVADRDTIALLVQLSLDGLAGSAPPTRTATSTDSPHLSDQDEADLALILAVLHAFQHHEQQTGKPSPRKPLRETIFFRWEGPRLPPGRTRSPVLPHSPAARAQRAEHGVKDLIYEHVRPVSLMLAELLRSLPPDITSLHRVLAAHAERVIITRDEDRALTRAGHRDSIPDPVNPWSRYQPLGLSPDDFAPFR